LSYQTNLIWLSLEWSPKTILPTAVSNNNLQYLSIRSYKNKSLETIPFYKNLIGLTLDFGSVVSLSGIERFINLRLYEHRYGHNLYDISALKNLPSLIEIELNHCRKIYIDNIFEHCRQLKILRYFGCANLSSLSFLKKLKDIEFFSFSDINIEDGDLTPLLKLKYFGFYPNKKHYSHTLDELRKIQQKNNQNFVQKNNANNGFYTITFDNGMKYEYQEKNRKDKVDTFVKKIENEFKIKCTRIQWSATIPSDDSSNMN
jgi:hypothetical protein